LGSTVKVAWEIISSGCYQTWESSLI
jgi:hypothetical protein